MSNSEAVTRDVRVRVSTRYAADHSHPPSNRWFFLYTVQIVNESAETVQLLSRRWLITDATGHIEEVRGPGVVGQEPVLEPGHSFEYTSGTPLATPYGSMRGGYQMQTSGGDRFEAEIAPFDLRGPYTVH